MTYTKTLVSLVAILALAISLIASVSASSISVEVSGIETNDLAVFAGQTVPVRVVFSADDNATDVRIKAWISGEKEYAVSTEKFDVVAGKVYSRLLSVQVPSRIDPTEDMNLEILVESRSDGTIVEKEISLSAQRESYTVEILDVAMDSEINAGEALALDIVLKNRGMQFSEDTFVKARIPALGVEKKAYFGDLAPVDQSDPDKEDAAERRIVLNVPSNAPAGLYLVELEVYNADSVSTMSKKVSIVNGASDNSAFVASANSKTFAVDEKAEYSLTLVNSGSNIRVYELVPETSASLTVDLDKNVVAVPAGASETVTLTAAASREGKYNFAVDIYSDGELVKKYNFLASVEGKSSTGLASNATLVLTVILAIIFVVLLIVLIVLLTRKPENKAEEFGESYY
jgi:hypothetical protein